MFDPASCVVAGSTQSGLADGNTVVNIRKQLQAWLAASLDITADGACDIVLATEEALVNFVDDACLSRDRAGGITMVVSHDANAARRRRA